MPRLEEIANVALRVPSILVLDLLYKCDMDSFTEHLRARNEDMLFKYKYVVWNMYYVGHLISVVLLALPLRHIVGLYLYVLTALLLYMGHQISRDYVRGEVQYGYEGAVYLDSLAFNRFVTALTSQIILSTLCAFLMRTRQVWLFSAHLLPLLVRLCAVSHSTLVTVSSFAMVLTGIEAAIFLLSNFFVPYHLARTVYREFQQLEAIELYRLLAVGISLWNQFAVPTLFSVFWFVLFLVQIYTYATASNNFVSHQGVLFVLLTSVSECCATPYSLLGLTFVVSYLALGLLNLCKFYLGGYAAVQNENVMHRGVTEGVTLLLLALQTGLLDMQVLQRTFLLSIILFIVVTSTLQSMIEITDPIILALGASRNRSFWRHFRGLSMCLFLLLFPGFMAYKISQFFHMDFWLLILVSSCMLTSLQVTGTLLIYSLFMVELVRQDPIESLDEIIYCVNAVSRVLEFLVALCVVGYGTWESLFGEWSWMGASVIIIHSYFNVWLRAQSGWRSFLLRREAAKKINSLPRASAEQLRHLNDVCAICFQEMNSAVVTHCGHFFHGNCLRKWLYVQETCPMCHQPIKPTMSSPSTGKAEDEAPATPAESRNGACPALGLENQASRATVGPEQAPHCSMNQLPEEVGTRGEDLNTLSDQEVSCDPKKLSSDLCLSPNDDDLGFADSGEMPVTGGLSVELLRKSCEDAFLDGRRRLGVPGVHPVEMAGGMQSEGSRLSETLENRPDELSRSFNSIKNEEDGWERRGSLVETGHDGLDMSELLHDEKTNQVLTQNSNLEGGTLICIDSQGRFTARCSEGPSDMLPCREEISPSDLMLQNLPDYELKGKKYQELDCAPRSLEGKAVRPNDGGSSKGVGPECNSAS